MPSGLRIVCSAKLMWRSKSTAPSTTSFAGALATLFSHVVARINAGHESRRRNQDLRRQGGARDVQRIRRRDPRHIQRSVARVNLRAQVLVVRVEQPLIRFENRDAIGALCFDVRDERRQS